MTFSNMMIAELSILGSFLCFLVLIIKKIWPLLINSLDNYIEKVRGQISSAEKLKEESTVALARANRISSDIQGEVENYKKKSEERIAQLEEENKRYIQAMKEKAALSLDIQLKTELAKQKEILVDKLADLVVERLSEKVKEQDWATIFSKEDFKKLSD